MFSDLEFGSDVQAERQNLTVKVLELPTPFRRSTKIEIEQTIRFRLVVNVIPEGLSCYVCGTHPPLPDNEAAAFLLKHSDGRLTYPGVNPVLLDGLYPVAGWRNIAVEGGAQLPCCPDCGAQVSAHLDLLKANSSKKEG